MAAQVVAEGRVDLEMVLPEVGVTEAAAEAALVGVREREQLAAAVGSFVVGEVALAVMQLRD